MYNVLLVDDEPLICKGLSALIDWGAYGFRVTDYALNAFDALKKTKTRQYDVIITDIKMPGIDGLELIKRLKEQKNDAKIVILSGYRDFEYARLALKHGVNSYLIKPVDEEDLIDTLEEIKVELEEDSKSRTIFSESLTIIREKMISDLCINGAGNNIDESEFERIGLRLAGSVYSVCMVDISDYINYEIESGSLDYPSIYNNIKNIIEKTATKYHKGFPFEVKKNIIGILICKNIESDFSIKSFCQLLFESIKACMECVIMTVGNEVEKYSDLPQSFEQARKLLEWKSFNQSSGISFCEGLGQINYSESFTNAEDLERLVEYVKDGKRDLVIKEVDNCFGRFLDQKLHPNIVLGIIMDMFLRLSLLIDKMGGNIEDALEENFRLSGIERKQSIRELKDTLLGICLNSLDYIKNANSNRSNKTIESIIKYVNENYHTDLNLKIISKLFYMSPVYLGRLFKSNTGMNFADYVNRCRIEHAEDLLANNEMKVSSICKEVGYNDVNYFIKVFKKKKGMTPSEFRNKMLINR
jgi:two-component system response regulator YesN